jgi:hypothetical protein
MKSLHVTVLTFVSIAGFASLALTQELSREQKLGQIKELNAQIDKIVQDLLLPSPGDIKEAETSGLKVFRLNPREIYGRIAVPSEGGSFYSFTTGSHDYQQVAQILLEQKGLSTGFAGANYGLMADLGDIPLSDVSENIREVNFLLRYKAPTNILEARTEQRKRGDYREDGMTFRGYLPAALGHTFVLRAIDFGRADTLVTFKLIRKDTDGSLIIFWRSLADFPKPQLDPSIKEN